MTLTETPGLWPTYQDVRSVHLIKHFKEKVPNRSTERISGQYVYTKKGKETTHEPSLRVSAMYSANTHNMATADKIGTTQDTAQNRP